jgi:hypothetical protein
MVRLGSTAADPLHVNPSQKGDLHIYAGSLVISSQGGTEATSSKMAWEPTYLIT